MVKKNQIPYNRILYSLLTLLILSWVIMFVFASYTDPSGVGHDISQIGIPASGCSDGQVLKRSGTNWICSLEVGPTGARGATGLTGAKGDKGNKGDKGDTGPAAPRGVDVYQLHPACEQDYLREYFALTTSTTCKTIHCPGQSGYLNCNSGCDYVSIPRTCSNQHVGYLTT